MKKSEAKKLRDLVEQWTRADVMSRMGRFDNLEFANYAMIKLEKENEIRQLLFGESEIVKLAEMWNMIPKRKRIKIKKKYQKIKRKI